MVEANSLDETIESFNNNLNKAGTAVVGYALKKTNILIDYIYHGFIGSLPKHEKVGSFIAPAYYRKDKGEKYSHSFLFMTAMASCIVCPYLAPFLFGWEAYRIYSKEKKREEQQNQQQKGRS